MLDCNWLRIDAHILSGRVYGFVRCWLRSVTPCISTLYAHVLYRRWLGFYRWSFIQENEKYLPMRDALLQRGLAGCRRHHGRVNIYRNFSHCAHCAHTISFKLSISIGFLVPSIACNVYTPCRPWFYVNSLTQCNIKIIHDPIAAFGLNYTFESHSNSAIFGCSCSVSPNLAYR